jgi:hypothetical protein
MDKRERITGLKRLREAIDDGNIEGIIRRYQDAASMPGDIGLIIAQR